MRNINIDNKTLINSYQPSPERYYDVEGTLVDKQGKDLKIQKEVDKKIVEYTLRVKEDVPGNIGDEVSVKRNNIQAMSLDSKEETYGEEETRDIGQVLMDLGLEFSQENIQMVEALLRLGIKPSKENIQSYKKSKEVLTQVTQDLDMDKAIRLMDRGIDIRDRKLEDVALALEDLKNQEENLSFKKFLGLKKDMTYKEAEKVAKDIYGQKMGKDIYDTIIILDREGIEITKDILDQAGEVLAKVKDLKDLEDNKLIQVISKDIDFSINNLYKLKHNYSLTRVGTNDNTGRFEEFTISSQPDIASITKVLEDIGLKVTRENISIAREFVLADLGITRENYTRFIGMKEDFNKVLDLAETGDLLRLIDRQVDVENEDITRLVEAAEYIEEDLGGKEAKDIKNLTEYEGLDLVESIEDKDLVRLIREGRDFNLANIKEIRATEGGETLSIDYKTVDKTRNLVDIFNQIGETPRRQVVKSLLTSEGDISLENLYRASKDDARSEIIGEKREEEDIIISQYERARTNLTTRMVKESIREAKNLERLDLKDLNKYIDRKIDKYREVSRLGKNLGRRDLPDRVLALVMKNNLDVTLGQVAKVDAYLKGEEGISTRISKDLKEGGRESSEYREELSQLQKDVSKGIREARDNFKEDYKSLLNLLDKSGGGGKEDRPREDRQEDFLSIQKDLSKNGLVLQVPVEIDGSYKDLNIIIGGSPRDLKKDKMSFSLSLMTDKLGYVSMDLDLVSTRIDLRINQGEDKLLPSLSYLERELDSLGYTLNLVGEKND